MVQRVTSPSPVDTSPVGASFAAGSGQNLYEIVLTGGPCGGKSSSLARLTVALEERGFKVLMVAELATTLISGGVPIAHLNAHNRGGFVALEEQMVLMHQGLRERYRAIAMLLDGPVVIIYDRAEMDCAAYIGRNEFTALLARTGLGYREVRDSYDLVVHLVSPAVDAPEFYSIANNPARYETVEEAALIDGLTLDAWTGARLVVIPNDTDFPAKLTRVEQAVLNTVGAAHVPAFAALHSPHHEAASGTLSVQRKFLLASAPDLTIEALTGAQQFSIETTYLRSDAPEVERSVRRRQHAGQESYVLRVKRPVGEDLLVRERVEARISRSEYQHLLANADTERSPVHKIRYVFVYAHQVFKLDELVGRADWLLEAELPSSSAQVVLPADIAITREVTHELAYRSHQLAASS